MNNKDKIVNNLRRLNLSRDESLVYIALLRSPMTYLEVSRDTGVNRTKVYRIVSDLEQRSLLSTVTDDTGTKIVASDPDSLQVELLNQEQELISRQAALRLTMPMLKSISSHHAEGEDFEVLTYEGVAGFKQMLWHELKAKGEVVIFDSANIDDLVGSKIWAEKHRRQTVLAGYKTRAMVNSRTKTENFTKNDDYMDAFERREISHDALLISNMIVVYNNSVATYCHQDGQKVGYEVVNKANAEMMRQMFEHYWQIAE
jgi:sugar-specific transcriptional regulator TrmB